MFSSTKRTGQDFRHVGGDQKEALRGHERTHPLHQPVGMVEGAECRRVVRKHAQNPPGALDRNRCAHATSDLPLDHGRLPRQPWQGLRPWNFDAVSTTAAHVPAARGARGLWPPCSPLRGSGAPTGAGCLRGTRGRALRGPVETLARRLCVPCDRDAAPLGAPLRRFWAGGRASVSGIASRSVQRCSSQPGRSARRAGSRASRDPVTSRTARRRPSLHLLGPSPEDALVSEDANLLEQLHNEVNSFS